MKKELWKPIKGYEGAYEISNFGRIKSLLTNVFLKTWLCKGGYIGIGLRKNGIKKTHSVHVLVALHFKGPKPSPQHEVHHRDFDRSNNHADNLEWKTRLENIRESVGAGRITGWRGQESPRAKHTNESVLKIRELYASGNFTQDELAKQFNVPRHNISKIINRQRWAHI